MAKFVVKPEGSDGPPETELQRWAQMPEKFGKVLTFLEGLSNSVDVFSR